MRDVGLLRGVGVGADAIDLEAVGRVVGCRPDAVAGAVEDERTKGMVAAKRERAGPGQLELVLGGEGALVVERLGRLTREVDAKGLTVKELLTAVGVVARPLGIKRERSEVVAVGPMQSRGV